MLWNAFRCSCSFGIYPWAEGRALRDSGGNGWMLSCAEGARNSVFGEVGQERDICMSWQESCSCVSSKMVQGAPLVLDNFDKRRWYIKNSVRRIWLGFDSNGLCLPYGTKGLILLQQNRREVNAVLEAGHLPRMFIRGQVFSRLSRVREVLFFVSLSSLRSFSEHYYLSMFVDIWWFGNIGLYFAAKEFLRAVIVRIRRFSITF